MAHGYAVNCSIEHNYSIRLLKFNNLRLEFLKNLYDGVEDPGNSHFEVSFVKNTNFK